VQPAYFLETIFPGRKRSMLDILRPALRFLQRQKAQPLGAGSCRWRGKQKRMIIQLSVLRKIWYN
jgi:hypothetical protein